MDIALPVGGEYAASTEYLTDCPKCGKEKKFSFNYVTKIGRCFVCGVGAGNYKRYRELHSDCVFEVAPAVALRVDGEKEYPPLDLTDYYFYEEARQYLTQRRVVGGYGIKYSPSRKSLYIPLTPCCESLEPAWQTRKLYGSSFWRNLKGTKVGCYVYGTPGKSNKAVVVEGVFDVLTPQLYGLGGHALLGSKISDEQCCFLANHYTDVLLWLDPDKAGYLGTISIKRKLEDWGLRVGVKTTPLDPGSYHNAPWLQKLRGELNG